MIHRLAIRNTGSIMLLVLPVLTQAETVTSATAESSEIDSPEIIVISANQQQQNWLNTPASIDVRTLPASGMLIDSGQLLQGIPGLQVDSRANFAQDTRLSLRGFGSRSAFGIRGIYLQQDGIPISSPDGQGQLSSVLLDNISQVEVLRGPMAVLYGNGAGGVISLRSATPANNAVSSALALGEQQQQYQFTIQQVNDSNSWQLAAKHFETNGYRPHSDARKQQVQFSWQHSLTDTLALTLKADWFYDPELQDPLSLTPAQWRLDPAQTVAAASLFDTEKSTRQRQVSMALVDSSQAPWQIALWQGEREVNQRLAFTGEAITSAGGDIALARNYHGINAQRQWQLTPQLSTLLGAAWVKSDDQRHGYVNQFGQRGDLRRDETNLAENRDLYARFSYQLHPRLTLDGGVRYTELAYEIHDRFIQGNNPDDSGAKTFYQHAAALGLTYSISNHWSWFLSSGLGFEAPTLAELAYKPEGSGLNLALAASENRQWESGFKHQYGTNTLSLSVFSIRSSDELLVASSNNGRTSYRNAGQTARDGIELQWQSMPLPQLKQALSITMLDARFQSADLTGKRLPGVAKTDAYWQWRYQPTLQLPLYLEWSTSYRSKVAIDDQNSEMAPAALTFDASAYFTHTLHATQLNYWLKLQNIADRKNIGAVVVNQSNGRAFEPAPGRQLSAGVALTYRW